MNLYCRVFLERKLINKVRLCLLQTRRRQECRKLAVKNPQREQENAHVCSSFFPIVANIIKEFRLGRRRQTDGDAINKNHLRRRQSMGGRFQRHGHGHSRELTKKKQKKMF